MYVPVFNEDLSESNRDSKPGCEMELHEVFSRGKTRGKEDACVFLCAKGFTYLKTLDWKTSTLSLLNVTISHKLILKITFKKNPLHSGLSFLCGNHFRWGSDMWPSEQNSLASIRKSDTFMLQVYIHTNDLLCNFMMDFARIKLWKCWLQKHIWNLTGSTGEQSKPAELCSFFTFGLRFCNKHVLSTPQCTSQAPSYYCKLL